MKRGEIAKEATVLGCRLDMLTAEEVVSFVEKKVDSISGQPVQIITAYSEFFVRARKDDYFRRVMNQAALVIPDGVGGLAAVDYAGQLSPADSWIARIIKGLRTGWHVLTGRVGRPVSGVWLFSRLIAEAADRGWRVYLLGGFGDTAKRLAVDLLDRYPGLQIEANSGEQNAGSARAEEDRVISRIKAFAPEILFVAYGPVRQEKWLAANMSRLKSRVAIGVGGTFDELTGKVSAAPGGWSRAGLKWLWRLKEEPGRWRRIIDAVIIFPLLVWRERS